MRYNASHFLHGIVGAHDDCCERSALLTNWLILQPGQLITFKSYIAATPGCSIVAVP
jgi:hypothetical protein